MQIWLTRDVSPMQQFRSVYTVDRFDGLVLQIDQYGGMGGSVRGFLSDGSISYKNHHNVDGLAFGHCDYAYRNLGRMSKITIRQDQGGFHVKVDDKECFSSNEVSSACVSEEGRADKDRSDYRPDTSSASQQHQRRTRTLSKSATSSCQL